MSVIFAPKSRARSARMMRGLLAQVLANLGAVFHANSAIGLAPKRQPEAALYHPDYRDEFPHGDDPYRYFRW
jgi:hypothetical protein